MKKQEEPIYNNRHCKTEAVGEVLHGMLHCSSLFAENYRKWKTQQKRVFNNLNVIGYGKED